MQEKIVRTACIYDGDLVKLDVHKVELPNGKYSKREIVRHPGAAAVVALDSDKKILLVRQFRLAADKVMLEIPAGTLNQSESPEECARRELQEEIGFEPEELKSLGGIYTAPGYTTEFIHLFLATRLVAASLEADVDEFIEVVRMSLDDVLELIDQGEIIDSKTVTGILRAVRYLKTDPPSHSKRKKQD